MKKIRSLPTILGLVLLLAGLAAGFWAVQEGQSWFLKAESQITPQKVKITNFSDSGFSVSWLTNKETSGFLKYGSLAQDLDYTALDDRDQISGQTGRYFTHHVTLKSLKPNSNYYFKIVIEDQEFDNNGQPYQAATGPVIQETPPDSDVAYGTVLKKDGSPAAGVIVYLSLPKAVLSSALTKSSGSWMISLNSTRTTGLESYAVYDRASTKEEIFFQGKPGETSLISALTSQDSPLPVITLGESQSFLNQEVEIPKTLETQNTSPASPSPETTPKISKFNMGKTEISFENMVLTILNPEEKEIVNSAQPAFIGTAPAGKTLTITVKSEQPIEGKVTADEDGFWEWSPPEDLAPGEHEVTVSYLDDKGKSFSITRFFQVLAAETEESDLPAFEASPTATLAPSPSPSSPSPTATLAPSPSPSSPSPTGTGSGVPDAGYFKPTLIFLILGVFFFFTGLFCVI